MIATLEKEIPKVNLSVASVGMKNIVFHCLDFSNLGWTTRYTGLYLFIGKPWHSVATLEGSDVVQSRQVNVTKSAV